MMTTTIEIIVTVTVTIVTVIVMITTEIMMIIVYDKIAKQPGLSAGGVSLSSPFELFVALDD